MSQVLTMIEEIERAVEEDGFDLTEWETEFLESVKRQAARGPLSDKQENILSQIWHRAKGE